MTISYQLSDLQYPLHHLRFRPKTLLHISPGKWKKSKENLPKPQLIPSPHPTWPTRSIWQGRSLPFLKHFIFLFSFWNTTFPCRLSDLPSRSFLLVLSHLPRSHWHLGVCQGASLVPILFPMYTHSFGDFAQAHGFKHCLYANDSQIRSLAWTPPLSSRLIDTAVSI